MIATALVSNEGAAGVYVFLKNYQFSDNSHLFMGARLDLGEFPQQRAYLDAVPSGTAPSAGSNDSSADDFFEAKRYFKLD